MIVMALIGLFMAILIPSYNKVRTASQIEQAETDLTILSEAIRQLAWDTGKWPGDAVRSGTADKEVWDLTTADAGLLDEDGDFPNWQGAYVKDIPSDPWGSPYFFDPDYKISGVTRVVVGSFGPNRVGRNVYDLDNIYVILDE